MKSYFFHQNLYLLSLSQQIWLHQLHIHEEFVTFWYHACLISYITHAFCFSGAYCTSLPILEAIIHGNTLICMQRGNALANASNANIIKVFRRWQWHRLQTQRMWLLCVEENSCQKIEIWDLSKSQGNDDDNEHFWVVIMIKSLTQTNQIKDLEIIFSPTEYWKFMRLHTKH